MPPGYQPGGTEAMGGGVPWESEDGSLLGRWWETMSAVNFNGRPFYAAAAHSKDAMPAVIFSTISGAFVGLVGALISLVLFGIWGAAMTSLASEIGGPGAKAAPSFGLAGLGVGLAMAAGSNCS